MKEIIISTLNQSKTILYPTDTVWGVGCDATDEIAVKKVYQIKNRIESKSLIILVESIEMLKNYIGEIPSNVNSILTEAKHPTTIIYKNPKGLAKNVVASDNTVAIRIVQDAFCQELIRELGKPIVSTSANISGMPTPKSFQEIESSILESVDYIVNLRQNEINSKPSRLIKIESDGSLIVLRE